ncbi:methylglyoxal synthase [Granulosicoccus antarcticus]|uniref:Methylglyoxal synthase n=1 Tax=Granulosicoccus antarcticus IMCC3135 TaxID=1192854 RepID=A0A2Z2NWS2_9GAMM|nr:methylglyoxal synthase [Granulosicoccus antarcticus]ASJ72187.1 Methylglyoxal synthase [Granulosicoccus antarcticus IMCC3135]
MNVKPRVALIAHDNTKPDLIEWAGRHRAELKKFDIVSTGTTVALLSRSYPEFCLTAVRSGPLGGDQQVGAMIANGQLDMMIFFEDVMTTQPHDVDIKALWRLAVLYELPIASNRITADLLMANLDIAFTYKERYPHPEQKHVKYLRRSVEPSLE